MTGHENQFSSLDALRGIAALGVMVFHAPMLGAQWMPGGYLAVDLFFMLSGFVIAHAYRKRMARGLRTRSFLYRRVIRLWPMLALGAVLGMVLAGGHAGALFLLPNPKSIANLFPANPPLWSLLAEALAYLAFALGLWRAGPRMLLAIVLICATGLTVLMLQGEPFVDFGAHWHTLGAGLLRLGFGFGAGMLIWHLWRMQPLRQQVSHWAWVPIGLVVLTMALVPLAGGPLVLVALFVCFPLCLWLALRWQVPSVRLANMGAALSYPLYCIHVPLFAWLAVNLRSELLLVALMPPAALLLHYFLDVPARRKLTIWLQGSMQAGQTRIGIRT